MHPRTIAAFVLGFAVGVLCLALGLWQTGSLQIPGTRAQEAARETASEPPFPPPDPLPDTEAGERFSAPAALPPEQLSPAASSQQGSADRSVIDSQVPADLAKRNLGTPIAGLDPKSLAGTFHDSRNGRSHEALDIMSPRGTPVLAVDEGNVVKLFTSKLGGLTVYQFDNSRTWCYYYAHLDRYAPGLKEGMLLRKGDVLGYVGSTGDASPDAPHLHFAIFKLGPEKKWWEGTAIDPYPVLVPRK
jgi:murein DD-endopeptidase MepM/ murein hydrolase activator NlpD